MRDLSGTNLEAAQKAVGDVLCKIVLTQQGDTTTKTYGLDTDNRILNLSHSEEEWSQVAQVLIDNRDGTLTTLALEGYSGVISYGYHTTSDEYSATAPLEVIAQKTDSMQGELVTTISLAGVFNMMGEDEASAAYTPEDTNGDTVKTILTAIANKTMACFSHCKSYTITFDSEDSLIDSYQPKDYFGVGFKESRLSAFKKALAYTKCKARIEDDGEIHVFDPADGITHYISGSTYNYEYNDAIAAANHNFFDKSVRKRLIIPNKVIVMNHPDHEDSYTGNATDATSYAALGDRYIPEHHYTRPTSNAQCTAIAAAILQNYQLATEKGHGTAPMNVGQEVMDFVLITDSRASDTRKGNIGFINRWYSAYPKEPTRFGFEFRFGSLLLPGLAGTMPPREISIPLPPADRWSPGALRADVDNLYNYLNQVITTQVILVDLMNQVITRLASEYQEAIFKKLRVTESLRIPSKE